MKFDQAAQGGRERADEGFDLVAGGGVLAVAGEFHDIARAEEKAEADAGLRGDGEVAGADVVNQLGRAGLGAEAVAHDGAVERVN